MKKMEDKKIWRRRSQKKTPINFRLSRLPHNTARAQRLAAAAQERTPVSLSPPSDDDDASPASSSDTLLAPSSGLEKNFQPKYLKTHQSQHKQALCRTSHRNQRNQRRLRESNRCPFASASRDVNHGDGRFIHGEPPALLLAHPCAHQRVTPRRQNPAAKKKATNIQHEQFIPSHTHAFLFSSSIPFRCLCAGCVLRAVWRRHGVLHAGGLRAAGGGLR
jgi:hypothetical protein